MEIFNMYFTVPKRLLILAFMSLAVLISGCTEITGELKEPLPPYSYITPTIQNLQMKATSISKSAGGILRLTCEWVSPSVVATTTAYLGFVRTIQNSYSGPVGVIASDVATITKDIRASLHWATVATAPVNDPLATEDFFQRFKDPIAIPSQIGTNQVAGLWSAEIPFPHEDIASAPVGVQQMILYMYINGYKTNTLSFEMTFAL